MGSRQVTLLRRGWELGRLTFEYKQPFSKLRESYILRDIETDLYAEVVKLRTIIDAVLSNALVGKTKDAFGAPYRGLERYAELTLPYSVKTNKIETNKSLSAEELKTWRAFLDKRAEEFKANAANQNKK